MIKNISQFTANLIDRLISIMIYGSFVPILGHLLHKYPPENTSPDDIDKLYKLIKLIDE